MHMSNIINSPDGNYMFKVNNGAVLVYLLLTLNISVSIVHFEQVNGGWT